MRVINDLILPGAIRVIRITELSCEKTAGVLSAVGVFRDEVASEAREALFRTYPDDINRRLEEMCIDRVEVSDAMGRGHYCITNGLVSVYVQAVDDGLIAVDVCNEVNATQQVHRGQTATTDRCSITEHRQQMPVMAAVLNALGIALDRLTLKPDLAIPPWFEVVEPEDLGIEISMRLWSSGLEWEDDL